MVGGEALKYLLAANQRNRVRWGALHGVDDACQQPLRTAVERWPHSEKRANGSQGCLPASVTWFRMNGIMSCVVSHLLCVVDALRLPS